MDYGSRQDAVRRPWTQSWQFFRGHGTWTEREWLEDAIAYLGKLPATRALVDAHSALRYASPSGDAVEELIKFWRDRSDDGRLIHDLQDETLVDAVPR